MISKVLSAIVGYCCDWILRVDFANMCWDGGFLMDILSKRILLSVC